MPEEAPIAPEHLAPGRKLYRHAPHVASSPTLEPMTWLLCGDVSNTMTHIQEYQPAPTQSRGSNISVQIKMQQFHILSASQGCNRRKVQAIKAEVDSHPNQARFRNPVR